MPGGAELRDPLTRLLALVFFLSGLASLLYQVAWQRLLTVHYGVGAVSITLIVTVYMFGLGLGGLAGGALAERVRSRLAAYCLVELALGGFGLASPRLLDALGRATAGSSWMLSAACMTLFLSVPTLLMGTTLPLVTKAFAERMRSFFETVSVLYFVNTLGAALGAVLASYVIISWTGLDTTVYVAVGINLLLVVLLLRANALEARATPTAASAPAAWLAPELGRLAWPIVFATGFLAIGYEIAWFRLIGILVKASPYAFSTVLAVYLLGIAWGSRAARPAVQRLGGEARSVFFGLQGAIGLYLVVSVAGYYHLTRGTALGALTRASFAVDVHPLPAWPSWSSSGEFLAGAFAVTDVLVWPVWFVLVPTLLMGASFPLAASLALVRPRREGATVGTIYFFNVMGNVLGAALTGFLLLPRLGTERTLLGFAVASLLLGACAGSFRGRPLPTGVRAAAAVAVALGAVALWPPPGGLYRTMHGDPGPGFETHVEEGLNGVVVTHVRGEVVANYIDGLGHGHRPGLVYQMMTLEALTWAPNARRALVIGYGTGSTVELLLSVPEVERVTLVELNETLLRNLRKLPVFDAMLSDPRLEVIVDDGRRYLLRSDQSFDLVLMDPLRSTTAYSNNLYSRQFFELAARRLAPDGVLMVWFDEHLVIPRTLATVLPHLRCYAGFCLASSEPMAERPERRREILERQPADVRRPLASIVLPHLADERRVLHATRGYPINEDWRPVSEYYLGLPLRRWLAGR